MNEQEKRELLVEYGKKVVQTGLVHGTWGNLSIRLDEKYMLVTPSGLDYNRLTADDMVKVKIRTLEYEGDIKPTSEKGLHGGIYEKRPEVEAVIHTHSKYCSIFAAARKSVPVTNGEIAAVFGQKIALAGYGLPGTRKLMKNTIEALGKNFGCIMANHGMICCGRNIKEAFDNCMKMEAYCMEYIESRYEKGDYK